MDEDEIQVAAVIEGRRGLIIEPVPSADRPGCGWRVRVERRDDSTEA